MLSYVMLCYIVIYLLSYDISMYIISMYYIIYIISIYHIIYIYNRNCGHSATFGCATPLSVVTRLSSNGGCDTDRRRKPRAIHSS